MYFDIHTHSEENARRGAAIFSCPTMDDAFTVLPNDVPYCSASVHPWRLTAQNADAAVDAATRAVQSSRVVAVGEVGLDKLKGAPFELQLRVFRQMVALSETVCKPLVIHNVKATGELIALKKELRPQQAWILHGFRGKIEMAESCLAHGFLLSFGENYSVETMRRVPMESIFLETDESSVDIAELYARAAQVRSISVNTLAVQVWQNVCRVFPAICKN